MTLTETDTGYDQDLVCGARGRSGRICRRPAGWGSPHPGIGKCRLHGGSTPNHVTAADKIKALRLLATYGKPRVDKQDPRDLVLELMQIAAGHMDWLGECIAELDERHLIQGEVRRREGEDKDGKPYWEVLEATAPHVLVKLYGEERDRLGKLAIEASKLGLLERAIQIEEGQALLVAGAVSRALEAVSLSSEQSDALRVALRRELAAIDTTSDAVN